MLLLIPLSILVYAHPGRTDEAGGHTNHSTGEYHYHHGYSEHQHYDMDGDGIVDCPYDFKTNAAKVEKDSKSDNSSSSFTDEYNHLTEESQEQERIEADNKNQSTTTKADTYTATGKEVKKAKLSAEDIFEFLFSSLLLSLVVFYVLACVFRFVELFAEKVVKTKIYFTDNLIRGLLIASAIIGLALSIYFTSRG
jgi:hypothetical protein